MTASSYPKRLIQFALRFLSTMFHRTSGYSETIFAANCLSDSRPLVESICTLLMRFPCEHNSFSLSCRRPATITVGCDSRSWIASASARPMPDVAPTTRTHFALVIFGMSVEMERCSLVKGLTVVASLM